MVLPLAAVGEKITAARFNDIVSLLNEREPGLFPVIPTSVAGTGVTLGASGKVSFSASTTVNINGCFTADYDNYLLVLDMTHAASNSITARLRVGGVDSSATSYHYEILYGTGASATAAATASAAYIQGDFAGTRRSAELKLYGPALAATTVWEYRGSTILTATTMGLFTQSGQHVVSTAYDGISLIAPASTITGSVRIYGYNNN